MLYRIRLDLAFSDSATAKKVFDVAKLLFPKARAINPGQGFVELPYVTIEECHHDEPIETRPPCKILERL